MGKHNFFRAKINGKEVWVSRERISRKDLPCGWVRQELRHDGYDLKKPVKIDSSVILNFYGTMTYQVDWTRGAVVDGTSINEFEVIEEEKCLDITKEFLVF